ncbi:hypothetical protein ARMSODRAFT_980328 [Armillaria solidipes]|uniref:Uncharacterized protein n=1 Tax=Armillaria solidipes TaxID=1076256 RepID=A0A2H3BIK9_9AGAR|nr:hypothetical protein ARMSODRAFT_980328 [Armillaria solidipes]
MCLEGPEQLLTATMKPVQVEGRHAIIVVGCFPPMREKDLLGKGVDCIDSETVYGIMEVEWVYASDANDERSLKVTKLGRSGARRRRGAGSRAKVLTDTEGRTTRDERCLGSERPVLQGRITSARHSLGHATLPRHEPGYSTTSFYSLRNLLLFQMSAKDVPAELLLMISKSFNIAFAVTAASSTCPILAESWKDKATIAVY